MPLLSWVPHRGRLPKLRVRTRVSGPPVLLLHGLMGSPGNFGPTAQALLEHGRPVLAPLYGQRGTAPLEHSFQQLRGVVEEALTHKSSLDIVGHSLGGLLGLRLAHAFLGQVGTLLGLGAAFRGIPTPRHRFLQQGIRAVMGRGAVELLTPIPFQATCPPGVQVISLISRADTVVPAASSQLGEVIWLDGVRHEHLPAQAEKVLAALGINAPDPGLELGL